ncbi:hypothetical protein BDA96_06G264700 [Sorghum bicolor]|uniref:Uncharacterized protein n=2 Tax=Sorghum bicolor TaxID=4558 RepID=A0A921UDA9_SORBI|nr:hypothetical protein BDA96_06G264700 [Sorghum bicolor]KXG27264.1 hypothetical protein SORBI_3006G241500 [Sorghum bicolor]
MGMPIFPSLPLADSTVMMMAVSGQYCCLLRGCDLRAGRQSLLARPAPLSTRHSWRPRALPRCQHAICGAVAFSAATDLQDTLAALKMLSLALMKRTVTC